MMSGTDCRTIWAVRTYPPMATSRKDKAPLRGNTLGERVADALVRQGMSKAELARATGMSWQSIHQITDHGVIPKLPNLEKIATVLSVTVEELMGIAAGQEPDLQAWAQFKDTTEYQSATAEERRAVSAIMWPSGREPTLTSYLLALQAVRAAAQKSGKDGRS